MKCFEWRREKGDHDSVTSSFLGFQARDHKLRPAAKSSSATGSRAACCTLVLVTELSGNGSKDGGLDSPIYSLPGPLQETGAGPLL